MKKTESKILIDSSAWLFYFFAENNKIKDLIESDQIIFTSTISLFEIKRKLIKDKYSKDKIQKTLNFIKKRSIILEINEEICIKAADISITLRLPAIDSIIYISAQQNNALLITGDNDFRNLDKVEILDK